MLTPEATKIAESLNEARKNLHKFYDTISNDAVQAVYDSLNTAILIVGAELCATLFDLDEFKALAGCRKCYAPSCNCGNK